MMYMYINKLRLVTIGICYYYYCQGYGYSITNKAKPVLSKPKIISKIFVLCFMIGRDYYFCVLTALVLGGP